MKQITLSEIENHLAQYLRLAQDEEVVIMHQGKAVGLLFGFATENDC